MTSGGSNFNCIPAAQKWFVLISRSEITRAAASQSAFNIHTDTGVHTFALLQT